MIQPTAGYFFPEPIADDACARCEGEKRGWTSYSTRIVTLCNLHLSEWQYDKFEFEYETSEDDE